MARLAVTLVIFLANATWQEDDFQLTFPDAPAVVNASSVAVGSEQAEMPQRQPTPTELGQVKDAMDALRNRPLQAVELAERLASLRDPLPDPLLAHVLWIQGSGLSLVERYPESLSTLIKAERLARSIGDDRLLRRVLRYKSAAAFECSDYSTGRDAAAEGLRLSAKMADSGAYVATLHGELAANESSLGNRQAAIEHLLTAVEISERCGARKMQSQMLTNAAGIMLDLGQYHTAMETFQRVLKLEGEDARTLVVVAALKGLGDTYTTLENFSTADEHLQRALDLCAMPGAERWFADVHLSIGMLCVAKGDRLKAKSHFTKALQKFQDLRLVDEAANLQQLLMESEEHPDVTVRIRLMESNLKRAQQSGDLALQAELHLQLAAAFRDKEEWRQASVHSMTAVSLQERLAGLELNELIAARLSDFSLKEKVRMIDELESEVSARNELLKAHQRWHVTLVVCIVFMILVLAIFCGLLIKYRRALHEVKVAKESLRKQKHIQSQIERRLAERQKSESLAVMASGIAHDFNNLLAGIAGLAELASISSSGNRKDELLGQITDTSIHASTLTGQLMQFLGKPRDDSSSCDVADVLESHKGLLQSVARPNLLKVKGAADPVYAKIDDNRLCQVLVNLISNASEASPAEYEISVSVEVVSLPESGPGVVAGENSGLGDYCRIQVADSGRGMTAATKARLFDPYFSTKALGRGLGLSSVIGIVRSCNGFVEVQSEPGAGCCFSVFLELDEPAVNAVASDFSAASKHELSREPEPERSESLQVLLVDDEQMLLDMQTQYLSMSGFDVVTANSAEEGWQVVKSQVSNLDCVVTDFCMSGKDGRWLAEQIRLEDPSLPIILCSGLIDGSLQLESDLFRVLAKPYSPRTLQSVITDCVRQASLASTNLNAMPRV